MSLDFLDPRTEGRRIFDALLESQYWSLDRMVEHQRFHLERLVRFARENVPFYADRFDALVRPDGRIDWDRWTDVPVLTRQDLQNFRSELLTQALPRGHGPTRLIRSSGSTGRPIETFHTAVEGRGDQALVLRAREWHGADFDKDYLNIRGDAAERGLWPDGDMLGPWGPPWTQPTGRMWELNLQVPPGNILEFMQRNPLGYVSATPTRLQAVALAAQSAGVTVPLDVFFARGEDVTLEQARLIEEVFGARIVRTYSSQETGKLAHACPECGRYHINSEIVIVEVVDDHGEPVAPGETGHVLVTPLLNLAMPLVRYRIGDLAIPGPANSCSRTLPVLERIAGRTVHLFRARDGRAFMPSLSDTGLLTLGAGMWQLAQTGIGRAELRLVARPGQQLGDPEAFARLAAAALPDFKIEIRQLGSLPPTASGKHIPYVSELRGD